MSTLKLTYNSLGANLSDKDGYVKFLVFSPGVGFGGGHRLYELTGPYSRRWVGEFADMEKAKVHAEGFVSA